jgi:hypothetical protein
MSSENIGEFVRDLLQKDDSLADVNNCRDSVSKIKSEITKKFPDIKTDILVFPEAREGDGVHYSLRISQGDKKFLVNTVAAPGFPEYIGDFDMATPTFLAMKMTPKVI